MPTVLSGRFSDIDSLCGQKVVSEYSGTTVQKVTPMMVSALVMNTHSSSPSTRFPDALRMLWPKTKCTPMLLPIQSACVVLTPSDQPGSEAA